MKATQRLHDLGQSLWLDDRYRGMPMAFTSLSRSEVIGNHRVLVVRQASRPWRAFHRPGLKKWRHR
jgi:hypothetical protein